MAKGERGAGFEPERVERGAATAPPARVRGVVLRRIGASAAAIAVVTASSFAAAALAPDPTISFHLPHDQSAVTACLVGRWQVLIGVIRTGFLDVTPQRYAMAGGYGVQWEVRNDGTLVEQRTHATYQGF